MALPSGLLGAQYWLLPVLVHVVPNRFAFIVVQLPHAATPSGCLQKRQPQIWILVAEVHNNPVFRNHPAQLLVQRGDRCIAGTVHDGICGSFVDD